MLQAYVLYVVFRRMLQQVFFMLQMFSLAGAGSIVQVEAEVVPADAAARVAAHAGRCSTQDRRGRSDVRAPAATFAHSREIFTFHDHNLGFVILYGAKNPCVTCIYTNYIASSIPK
jgi:hypothetical protein